LPTTTEASDNDADGEYSMNMDEYSYDDNNETDNEANVKKLFSSFLTT
jgi:hypothetical protein